MGIISGFFLSLALLIAVTTLTLASVQRPLNAILTEVCGAPHRARFWTRFFCAMLLLAMLFCTLWSLPDVTQTTMTLQDIVGVLRGGLVGVIGAMGALALGLLKWQARFEKQTHADAWPAPEAPEGS